MSITIIGNPEGRSRFDHDLAREVNGEYEKP